MTARRSPSLRRQALALEPRFLLDAAIAATAATVVDATDSKPGASAEGAAAHVDISESSTTHQVDLFSGVAVATDNGGEALDKLVVTVDRSGANQALVIDGTEISLTAGNGITQDNNYVYSVQVGGDGTTTITLTLASSDTASGPAGAAALIDGMAYRSLDNSVESGKVTVTLKSLSDLGGDTTELGISATVDVNNSINVAPVLTDGGHLDPRESLSLGDLGNATEVVYSAEGKFAYAAGNDGIQVYSVDSAGALTALQTFKHADLNTVSHMLISADGKSIYTVSSNNDSHLVHLSVAADGTLSYGASVTSGWGTINGGLALSGDGKYVYVGTQYDGVVIFERDASTGDLNSVGRLNGSSGRSGMIATSGDYLYMLEIGMPHTLFVYERGADGQLNQIDTISVADVGSGYSAVDYALTTSADGKTLYIGNPVKGAIHVYQVDGGALNLIGSETQAGVRGIALSPDGNTLYAASSDGSVSVYTVAANGALALAGKIAGSGNGADVAVSADGHSILVAGGGVVRYSGVQTLDRAGELAFADGVNFSDSNFDALNGGAGNYNGASITIQASVADGSFGFAAGDGLSLSGNDIVLDGAVIGSFVRAGDTLTITFSADTSKAVANQVLHQVTYRNANASRDALIVLAIRGGDGALDSNTIEVALQANSAPQLDDTGYGLDGGQTETDYSVTLPAGLFKDVDGDALTWTVSGLPAGLSFDPATRTISGTVDATGTYSVKVTVTDIHGGTASTTLSLVMDQIDNRAPTVNPAAPAALDAATAGQTYTVKLDPALFSDADSRYGDTLTWRVDDLPAGLSFDAATLTITGTASALGSFQIRITATDASGATATHTATLRVISQAEAGNTAPTVGADADKLVYGSDGTLSGYNYYVNSITTSADGSLVIIAGSTGVSAVGGASSQGDNFLSIYQRDSKTGELKLLQTWRQGTADDGNAANGIEVDGLGGITSVTLSKDGKFVYVAGYGAEGSASKYAVSIFSVNADGTLASVGKTAYVDQKIVEIALSSDGEQLIVLSTNTLYSYTVGDDGTLVQKQALVPLFDKGFNSVTRDLDIDANGTVYAMSNGRMAIYTYDSATNMLTFRGLLQNSGGVVFHEYAADGTFVKSTTIASSGAFSTAYSLAASGDGNFYITTYSNFAVMAFHYDAATNSVTFTQQLSFANPNYPTSVETSADGSTLYVGFGFSGTLNAYRIGDDGQLTLVQNIATGVNRVYRILATETGELYVGNFASGGGTGLGLASPTGEVRGSYLEGATIRPADGFTLADTELDARNDGTGNYQDATITVARAGGANGDDSFGFADGNGLTLVDGKIYLNGSAIASFDDSGNALSIVFTGETSSAVATAVLRQITYTNRNGAPGDSIKLSLAVKDEYTATTLTLALAVTEVNDAPTAIATPRDGAHSPGDAATDLFDDVEISPVEAGQTISAITLTVGGLRDGASESLLIDGEQVALVAGSGTTTGGYGYVITVSGSTATVTLTHGTGMTGAAASALVDGLGYANSNPDATAGERTITLSAVKDSGGTANGGDDTATPDLTARITVQAEAPTLGADTGSLTFEEIINAIADDGFTNLYEGIQGVAVSGDYVYVVRTASVWDSSTISDVEVSSLYVLQRGADGKLTLVESFESKNVAALGGAAGVQVSADGNSVFVVGNNGVVVFDREAGGALALAGTLGADLIAEHGLIRDVQSGPNGTLYVTAGDSLLVYGRGQDGSLSVSQTLSDAGTTGMQLDGAGPISLSPDGRFVFVGTSGGATLASVFRVEADGSLSFLMAAQGESPAADPMYFTQSLTLSPDGTTLYAIDNDGSDYRLYTLTIGADGTLTAQADTVLDGEANALVVSQDGALLIVVGPDQISLYTRGADGVPTAAGTLTSLGGKDIGELRGATLSADGKQLYLSGTVDWYDGLLVLNLSPASSTYTEGGDAVALLPGGNLSDPQLDALDNGAGDYQGASIVVERDGGANADDIYTLVAGDGYTLDTANGRILLDGTAIASFTQAGGKLTVVFTATVSQTEAQQVLRRIAYENGSSDPTRDGSQARFAVTLNDGDGHSATMNADVDLIGVNDPPVIDTTPLAPTYPAEGEPVKLFDGTTIDTVEAGQNVWQVIVTVTPAGSQDILGADGGRIPLGSATSGVQRTATGLEYSVQIANGVTTVVLYLNNSPERAAQVIDSLTYSHTGDSGSGSVSIGVNVRENADSNALSAHTGTAVVTLAGASAANTAPVLGGGTTVGYTEQADPTAIAPGATVADAQMDGFNNGLGNYNGSTLTVALGAGASAADSLGFVDGNGLTRVGDQLLKDGKPIGRFSVADGTLTIQFTDEAGAIPTQADVQNALRQVTYANGSDVPAERVAVRVTLSDQRGLESAAMAFDIDITAVNDLPVVEADPVLSLGELAAVQHLTDLAGMSALTTSAASADGLTVYVADGNGAIALFSRDAGSGELTLVRVLSGTSDLDGVKALQLSADGTSLYALHENGNAIVWFSVDGDGGLTRAGAISSDYAVDGGNLFDMRDIALSADGKNLYLTNAYNVVILARDGGSGALSYVGAIEGGMWSAPYLWAPTEVVTRGDLVFVVTNTSSGSSLIVYQRDADGALTLLGNASNNGTDAAGQPVSLDGLEQLAVSADGRTIFVANGAQIDAFALDPATGALTHKGVFASNLAITDLALTADGRALFATLADGSVNYYATANGALVGSHGGMPGAGQVVLLPDGGLVVIGDGVDVLTAPPGTAPVAVIGGDPVAVAPAVKLSDAELDAAAAGAGNYQGASVTFTGNAGDSFSFLAGDGYTLGSDGITILLDGTAIATLVQTDGAATLAFTGAVTTAQANALVHRVGYSAGGDTAGTRSVSVRMNDGADESAAHLIEVIAAEPNHAPEVGAADYTPAPVAQGRPYEVVLPDTLFSDPDGDTLTWEVSGLPPGLSFDAATRTISGTTTAALADYPVQVKVSDPSGATATRTLTLEVAEAPNTEPVDSGISLAPGQPEVGAPYRYTIPAGLFTDADGDTLTWTVTGLPEGLSFDAATRTISGVATEAGQYVLKIAASDPAGAQVSRSLGLDVVVAASPPAPQPAGDAPPPLPQVQAWNVPDDTARDPAEDPALAASVARPIDAPATDATGMGGAVAPFGAPAGGSAVLLDGLLRSSLERDDRWTRGLNGVETADGKPTRLVALASPDAPALAGPGRPVTAAWHYDRDNNRQVVTLPAGLVRSSSAIAALELRMADGGALPAGVRLDAARGLITAPGLNGGQPLSLQLLVRTVDGQRLAVPILITGERQAAAAPAAPNDAHAAAHAAAHEGDLAAASKLALSVQLRQSAAQDILAQAQQLLAALGEDPAPALPAAVNEPHAGHRQASSLSVQS